MSKSQWMYHINKYYLCFQNKSDSTYSFVPKSLIVVFYLETAPQTNNSDDFRNNSEDMSPYMSLAKKKVAHANISWIAFFFDYSTYTPESEAQEELVRFRIHRTVLVWTGVTDLLVITLIGDHQLNVLVVTSSYDSCWKQKENVRMLLIPLNCQNISICLL